MGKRIKEALRRNWFAVLTMTLSLGVLLYFLFRNGGVEMLGGIIASLKWEWSLCALGAVGLTYLLEGYVLNLFCRHLVPSWQYLRSFNIGLIGLLYSALTPFSTGGQPMQIYTMKKMGMDTGSAGAIIAVKTLVYQIVMVGYAMILVVLKLGYFQHSVSNFSFLTIIGLLTNSAFIVLVLMFTLSSTVTDKMLRGSIKLLTKLHLCKHPEERYAKIHGSLSGFHDSARIMGKSFKMYASAVILTMVQITLSSMIPYFIYRSFGLEGESLLTVVAAQTFVSMVSAFVPLPGASGGAEGSFVLFFGKIFGAAVLPATLIWRMLTYYSNILFGCVAAYFGGRQCQAQSVQPEGDTTVS